MSHLFELFYKSNIRMRRVLSLCFLKCNSRVNFTTFGQHIRFNNLFRKETQKLRKIIPLLFLFVFLLRFVFLFCLSKLSKNNDFCKIFDKEKIVILATFNIYFFLRKNKLCPKFLLLSRI